MFFFAQIDWKTFWSKFWGGPFLRERRGGLRGGKVKIAAFCPSDTNQSILWHFYHWITDLSIWGPFVLSGDCVLGRSLSSVHLVTLRSPSQGSIFCPFVTVTNGHGHQMDRKSCKMDRKKSQMDIKGSRRASVCHPVCPSVRLSETIFESSVIQRD